MQNNWPLLKVLAANVLYEVSKPEGQNFAELEIPMYTIGYKLSTSADKIEIRVGYGSYNLFRGNSYEFTYNTTSTCNKRKYCLNGVEMPCPKVILMLFIEILFIFFQKFLKFHLKFYNIFL